VPNFGKGGSVGDSDLFWLLVLVSNWYTFFCLSRLIFPPEIFESGKNIGLDPLVLSEPT
jgi:hypothetical protein